MMGEGSADSRMGMTHEAAMQLDLDSRDPNHLNAHAQVTGGGRGKHFPNKEKLCPICGFH